MIDAATAPEAATATLAHTGEDAIPVINAGAWITLDHAAVLIGVSTRTLQSWIKTGRAPEPHRFSPRRVRYLESEFRTWLAARNDAARLAGAEDREPEVAR